MDEEYSKQFVICTEIQKMNLKRLYISLLRGKLMERSSIPFTEADVFKAVCDRYRDKSR